LDGLLHISKLARGKKIKHARDVLSRDAEIEVKIEKIDRDNKRISLDVVSEGAGDSSAQENAEDFHKYLPKTPRTMGTLGDLLKKSGKKF
jgi:ribosomal protein S1